MKNKKNALYPALALVLALAFTFAACEDGNGNPGNENNGEKTVCLDCGEAGCGGKCKEAPQPCADCGAAGCNGECKDEPQPPCTDCGAADCDGECKDVPQPPCRECGETGCNGECKDVPQPPCRDCGETGCNGECKDEPQPPCRDCGETGCNGECKDVPPPPCPDCGETGCDGKCKDAPPPPERGINIVRSQSTPYAFVFSVNPVPGATAYHVFKDGNMVASSPNPENISVAAVHLTDRELTPLTVRAMGGAGQLWEGGLSGMLKYPTADPTLSAYSDWFRFLDATNVALMNVNSAARAPHGDLFTAVRHIVDNGTLNTEEVALEAKDIYEGMANNAMAAVLANYPAIVDWLAARPEAPVAVQWLKDIEETLPRIWFNSFLNEANDATLNNMMRTRIQAQNPDVKNVSMITFNSGLS